MDDLEREELEALRDLEKAVRNEPGPYDGFKAEPLVKLDVIRDCRRYLNGTGKRR